MNLFKRNLFFALLFILHGNTVSGQKYRQTINVQLPSRIDFINIGGRIMAYYEIYLTNFSTDTLKLEELTIKNIEDFSAILKIRNRDFEHSYRQIGSGTNDTTRLLAPGNSGVIYVELVPEKQQIKKIEHRIVFEATGKEDSEKIPIQTDATACSSNTQLVLGAPLKSGIWTAVYDPRWERGHRRVIYTLNGKARIPGRFAIDFIKIDSTGKYANGGEDTIMNWLGYGEDVLAVADGIVSSLKDDFSESQTLSDHTEYTADKATGNYISIKIGKNQFAFYEHLKPGSIKVKAGQKVKKGDVIASVGFTGQTTGPHLHFHIADADSPLGAEGIPFVFTQFQLLGSYEDFEGFGKTTWTPINDLRQFNRNFERPKPNAVIKFR